MNRNPAMDMEPDEVEIGEFDRDEPVVTEAEPTAAAKPGIQPEEPEDEPAAVKLLEATVDPESAEPHAEPEPAPAPPSLPRGEFHHGGDAPARDSVKNGGRVWNAKRDVNQPQGDLHVTYNYATADPESGATRKRASLRDSDAVAERAKTAVWPPGLEARYPGLKANRLLILTCPTRKANGVRCGQNTAAQLLLSKLTDDVEVNLSDRLVHKLFIDQKERLLQVLNAEVTSTTYYADLVDVEESQLDQTLEDLGDIVLELRDAESYLVLSFPQEYKERLERAVPGRVQELLRPSGSEVFERHLAGRMDQSDIETLLADTQLSEVLTGCWPVTAVALAREASLLREKCADITKVIADLRDFGQDWTQRLREELDINVDPLRRCLLLSAAVLQGAEPGVVVHMAHELIKATKFDLPRPHPLEEPSAVFQLSLLGTKIPFNAERVEFREPGFADAILPYVWQGYRPLRPSLANWLKQLPRWAGWYSTNDLNRLADAVVQLGAEVDATIATGIARYWATPLPPKQGDSAAASEQVRSKNHTRRSLAVRVLTECAVNDRIGFKVRNQLWNWAYNLKDANLLAVVAQVCGTSFGVEFPRNALTRLRHISTNEDPLVRREVVAAIRNIARNTDLPSLHQYLLPWLGSGNSVSLPVLAEAYATVLDDLDPVKLGRGTGNRPLLTAVARSFWARAYEAMPQSAVGTMVAAWLRLAERADNRFGDAMVRMLTQATNGNLRHAAVLSYALRPDRTPTEFPPTRHDQLIAQICSQLDELETAR